MSKKLSGKTRVLVTHKLESLSYVDHIYIFKQGEIVASGNFEEIRKTSQYQEIEEQARKEAKQEEEKEKVSGKSTLRSVSEDGLPESPTTKMSKKSSFLEEEESKKMMEKLMMEEDRRLGAVTVDSWKSMLSYLWNGMMRLEVFCWTIVM